MREFLRKIQRKFFSLIFQKKLMGGIKFEEIEKKEKFRKKNSGAKSARISERKSTEIRISASII